MKKETYFREIDSNLAATPVQGSPEELAKKCDQEEQTKFICDVISSIMQYIIDPESDEEDLLKHLRFLGCNDQIIDHVVHVVCNSKGYIGV